MSLIIIYPSIRTMVIHVNQHSVLPPSGWLSLDSISYMGLDETLEAHVEIFYVNGLAYVSHHPSVANYFTVELTVLKEVTQELADLFRLTLPVSRKKQARQMVGYPLDQSRT
jgi:hypothetical protein